MHISFFGLPLSIPAWLFGIAFVGYSIYGIKSKRDNIGHEAHLGGALVGMLIALLMEPSAIMGNYITILLILVPSIVFMYLIVTRPGSLLIDNFFYNAHQDFYSVDHKYNTDKFRKQSEIDRILDKINTRGIGSLTRKERSILEEYSRSEK